MNQIDGVLKNKRGEIIMPQTIIRQVEGLVETLDIIKADIRALQNSGGEGDSDPVPDIGALSGDVKQLQNDVEILRSDANRMASDLEGLRNTISLTESELLAHISSADSIHAEMDNRLSTSILDLQSQMGVVMDTALIGVRVDGETVPVTDHYAEVNLFEKYVPREEMPAVPTNTEIWTFKMEDGTTVTKEVFVR